MTFRVAITRPIHTESMARLRSAGVEVESAEPQSITNVDAIISQLGDRIDAEVIQAVPRLRLIANVAAGVDNIDVEAANRAGVLVGNTPGVLSGATADLALALMLCVARRIPESDSALRRDGRVDWSLFPEIMGFDISGRTLGIVGMGRIGLAVARRAMFGFGMRVLYSGGSGEAARGADAMGAAKVPLDELLAASHVVSLHVPLTDQTHHLLDEAAIALMRRDAILINTARGAVVDEAALVQALRTGSIAGAGLDVFEYEPIVSPELVELRERVVLTPHIGSATSATRLKMSEMAVDNVLAVASGRPPVHAVRWTDPVAEVRRQP